MRFSLSLPELYHAIQLVMPAIPAKSTLYVLEHIHCSLVEGTLVLVTTDQELTISTSLSVISNEDGEILIPARTFAEIIKALGNEGQVEISANLTTYEISIRTSFGQYNIKGMHTQEFLQIPEFPQGTTTNLTKSDAQRIADKTIFAVSDDDFRPSMTGVLFEFNGENITTVATDGFRLVKVITQATEGSFPSGISTIIPARAVALLSKATSDTVVAINKTHAQFIFEETQIVTRLIDEKFPPYENVIPKDNNKTCVVLKPEMHAAVKRAALFANPATGQIKLEIDAKSITVTAGDPESGNMSTEQITCEFGFESMEIGFNHKFLIAALEHIGVDDTTDQKVVLSMSTPTRAILIKPLVDNEDLLMLVMPMRIS